MRAVVWKDYGLPNSYTMESSFSGADFGRYADFHFNTEHLMQVGYNFCEAVLDFCDPDQSKVKLILEELEIMFPRTEEDESDEQSDAESDWSDEEGKKKKKKSKDKKGKKKIVEKSLIGKKK